MPALCLMLSGTYYAKNYAGIIGRGLSAMYFHFCKIARILSSTQRTDTYSQYALICSHKFNYYL